MSLSRRQFLSLAGMSTTSLALGGCAATKHSSRPAAVSSSSAAADPKRSVSYWTTFDSTDQVPWFQKNVIDAFNAQSKIGTVKMVVKPVDSFAQNIKLALTAGNGPDILTGGITDFVTWNRSGYVRPLDDIVAASGWAAKFQPWALDLGKVDQKLLMIPQTTETMIVMYNPDVFTKNGWTFPTTREEFETICADADSKGMTPVAAGNADYQGASEWHVGYFLNNSAGPEQVYKGLTGDLRWTDPVFVDAIEQLNGYMQKGWWGGSPDRYFTNKFDAMYRDLASGKAAFIFTGSWGIAEIGAFFGAKAGNSANWDWKFAPALSAAGTSDIYQLSVGGMIGVSSKSTAIDLISGFLDFALTDIPLAASGLAEVNYQPAPIKMTAAQFAKATDSRTSRVFTSLSSAKSLGYTTWTFWPGDVDTYILTEIDKVFAGKMSTKQYLQGLDDMYQKALKAGQTLPVPKPSV